MPEIEVRNLCLHIRNVQFLDNVSFFIQKGETVVLMGASGSGKSLLFSALLGLLPISSGNIRIGHFTENDYGTHQGLSSLYESIGVVLQQPALVQYLTVEANMKMVFHGARHDIGLPAVMQRIGLSSSDLNKFPFELSEGTRRRIAVARAYLRQPQITLLDEPTAGLDPENVKLIGEFVRREHQENQVTSFIISHDPVFVAMAADRRVLFFSGETIREYTFLSKAPQDRVREIETQILSNPFSKRESEPSSNVKMTMEKRRTSHPGLAYRTAEFVAGGIPITLIASCLLGAILMIHSAAFTSFPIARFLPALVTRSLAEEIIPLVLGLLMAGKIGSHIAAEVGGMAVGQQILSLRLLNLSPLQLIGLPIISAMLVSSIFLISLGIASAFLTAAWAFGLSSIGAGAGSRYFFEDGLHHLLSDKGAVFSIYCKAALIGLAISLSGYFFGIRARSARSLGGRTTQAVATACLLIILIDVLIILI